MNHLIKITKDDDGPIDAEYQRWHALVFTDTQRTACGFAVDACTDVQGPEKHVERGGITCRDCINTIKEYKEVRF